MPVGERQKLITEIVAQVLKTRPETNKPFVWFKNTHTPQDFGAYFHLIDKIFRMLGGDSNANKRVRSLHCDAYFGGEFNFILEFDECQHFSTARLKTLEMYPVDLQVAFDIQEYQSYCQKHYIQADKYFHAKTTTDFNFAGGRTAQRAYLDCFRDILPSLHGLRPTLRINQFEVIGVVDDNAHGRAIIEQLLEKKLNRARK